jgi:hypothetical protein
LRTEVSEPLTVRSKNAHVCDQQIIPDFRSELEATSLSFTKPRADDHGQLHPGGRALSQNSRNERSGHGHHRDVNGIGHVCDARIRPFPLNNGM